VSTSPTWYDVLDVAPTATEDEVRSAWKAAIEGLDPTDRRFRTMSEAAGVLLDADERAAYDRTLERASRRSASKVSRRLRVAKAAPASAAASDGATTLAAIDAGDDVLVPADATTGSTDGDGDDDRGPRRPGRVVRGWTLATLGVLAAACVTAAALSASKAGPPPAGAVTVAANDNHSTSTTGQTAGQALNHDYTTDVEGDGAAALAAAKAAVVPVLSYDYRSMAAAKAKADSYLTPSYQAKYDQLFALLQQNAPNTQTVVKTNPPVDAGVVRVSPGLVQVLVFVDRPTTNKLHKTPINYQNYVTLTMQNLDGRWLVDNMTTS
jgi:Mce-associated membrane protein